MCYLITLFLSFFLYCFSRRQRITPRIALPPPIRNAYSRSTSFSQQSGVYSRSSSFDQQTSGFQQRSESLKQQQPAAPKRPDTDTYASERALEDRIVCISFLFSPSPSISCPNANLNCNTGDLIFTCALTSY